MTRSQLITKVANDTNMTAAEVEKVMDGIFLAPSAMCSRAATRSPSQALAVSRCVSARPTATRTTI